MMPGLQGDSGASLLNGLGERLREYVADSNEALSFRLVRSAGAAGRDDLDEVTAEEAGREGDFPPEMTHQIYGENENIFGWRDPKVVMMLSAGGLQAFISRCAGDPLPKDLAEKEGLKADELVAPLVKLMADGQVSNSLGEFRKYLREEEPKFKPLGEKVHEWTREKDDEHPSRQFEIYKCDHSVPGFIDYHKRLQPWIMFYIDAASYIDSDDPNWLYFVLYERHPSESGPASYSVAGFITVYQYYGYPQNVRPRVSQMLVLPPFQRMGLGAKLLDTVQKQFWKDDKVIDITVEDPSEEFVRLRDYVDCANCLKLLPGTFDVPTKLAGGFQAEMHKEAQKEMKICKRQARRVYEILRLRSTNRNNPEQYKAYRIDIKKRLNLPFKKEESQLAKLKKHLKPEEFAAATAKITNRKERLETLQTQYEELEDHYEKIIKRLPA